MLSVGKEWFLFIRVHVGWLSHVFVLRQDGSVYLSYCKILFVRNIHYVSLQFWFSLLDALSSVSRSYESRSASKRRKVSPFRTSYEYSVCRLEKKSVAPLQNRCRSRGSPVEAAENRPASYLGRLCQGWRSLHVLPRHANKQSLRYSPPSVTNFQTRYIWLERFWLLCFRYFIFIFHLI